MITKDNFLAILPFTLRFEGGYANVNGDKGGETYRGISRKANPKWEGWAHLEKHKPLMYGDIINDEQLKQAVRDLYYQKYFEPNKLHLFNNVLPALMCFDFAVHGGFSKSKLQDLLNRKFGFNLVADGILGVKSLEAINSVDPVKLSHEILDLRKKHLDGIIQEDPTQEKFRRGWDSRIKYLRSLINSNTKIG